jgi:hypothetical protein
MTRKAIIIGNNTGYNAPKHLSGVNKDLLNYKSYLKSDIGGEWVESEIIIMHNNKKAEIIKVIDSVIADYTFVVFTGHGFISAYDRLTYACVSDGYVSEKDLDTRLSKQTLIMDCCRTVEREQTFALGGRVYENLEKGDVRNLAEGARTIAYARQIFDSAISQSSLGQCRAYACDVNQTSGDNPASGGVFSTALMQVGIRFGSTNNYNGAWLAIKDAVASAANNINSDPLTNQNPTFRTIPQNMYLTHPFAVTNHINRTTTW